MIGSVLSGVNGLGGIVSLAIPILVNTFAPAVSQVF
jgi:hypothetical protein